MSEHIDLQATVESYLREPDTALVDWHRGVVAATHGVSTTEAFPWPLDRIRGALNDWVDAHREFLCELICNRWGYNQARSQLRVHAELSIAVSLAEYLAHHTYGIPVPIATAVVLLQHGLLEKLCAHAD